MNADRLRSALNYDSETGVFAWSSDRRKIKAGQRAGSISHYGYVEIRVDGKLYKAHRLAWLYVHGEWPDGMLDHINGVKTDNRICNLREASCRENCRNRAAPKNNTSGVKGVSWSRAAKKWMATITDDDGRVVYLGVFVDKRAAADVRAAETIRRHGEFARV